MRRDARLYLIAPLVWAALLMLAVTQPPAGVRALGAAHRVFLPGLGTGSAVQSTTERQVFDLINIQRRAAGCPAVQLSRELGSASTAHSQDMAQHNFMSHTGSDGSNFGQRAQRAGYRFFAAGEVIGTGYNGATAMVVGWMNSPGHRAIILNCKQLDIGVGYVAAPKTYWTAVFGQR